MLFRSGYNELATINGKLAQVVKIIGDDVTLQVFEGTGGIPTNAEVVFMGKSPSLKVSDQLAGRFFNAYGQPIDGGPEVEGKDRNLYPLQFYLYQVVSNVNAVSSGRVPSGAAANLRLPAETMKMAVTIVTIGPILFLYPFIQRYFVQGIMTGAVKE